MIPRSLNSARWVAVSLLLGLLVLRPAMAQTADPARTQPLVDILSRALGLAREQVVAYQQTTGLGSLVFAAHLAALSGQPMDALIARHAAGEGWGAIARSLGLQPGRSQANLGALVRADRATGKPEHAGPPDHAGRPDHAGGPDAAPRVGPADEPRRRPCRRVAR